MHRRPHGDFFDPLGLAGVPRVAGNRVSCLQIGGCTSHIAQGGGGGGLAASALVGGDSCDDTQPTGCLQLLASRWSTCTAQFLGGCGQGCESQCVARANGVDGALRSGCDRLGLRRAGLRRARLLHRILFTLDRGARGSHLGLFIICLLRLLLCLQRCKAQQLPRGRGCDPERAPASLRDRRGTQRQKRWAQPRRLER